MENGKYRIVFLIMGSVMILSEIVKQIILTVHYGGYQFWYLPFQLCSIPMYAAVIVGSVKPGKLADACISFIATFGLLAGIMAFCDTSGFQYEIPVLTVYSYVWHIMLILMGLYANAVRRSFTFMGSVIVFLICVGVAELINLLCRDKLINMFYINPKYLLAQVGFRILVEPLGNAAAIIAYILGIIVGAGIINVIAWLVLGRRRERTMKAG